jgi:ribonuclease HII
MHLIIATDEAGYGPKLGPLVIVATAWLVPSKDSLNGVFRNLGVSWKDERCGAIFIDDSKKVFKRNARYLKGQEPLLDIACRVASRWASLPDPGWSFAKWLKAVAPLDFKNVASTPWFAECLNETASSPPMRSSGDVRDSLDQAIVDHWSGPGAKLCSIQARMITAAEFNKQVDSGKNKADILTESTCSLVQLLVSILGETALNVSVFSDRHGGRAYYGAALQHHFADSSMHVVHEDKHVSTYALKDTLNCGDVEWSFTVSGDSFAPVAMSSMIAKWLREQAMEQLNEFFQRRLPSGISLSPTAGYPSDADRYLADLQRLGLRRDIDDALLIRKR